MICVRKPARPGLGVRARGATWEGAGTYLIQGGLQGPWVLGQAQVSLRRRRALEGEGEGRDGALPTQSEVQSFICTHFTYTWAGDSTSGPLFFLCS